MELQDHPASLGLLLKVCTITPSKETILSPCLFFSAHSTCSLLSHSQHVLIVKTRGSAARNTGLSFGPLFDSQHSHGSSQSPCVIPVQGHHKPTLVSGPAQCAKQKPIHNK